MHTFKTLLDLACGRKLPDEESGPARRMQLTLLAALGAVIFAAAYGVAAGSTSLGLAAGNAYKVPMVLLLSALCALPGGLLAWRLIADRPIVDLMLSVSIANFTAAMVLAVMGPLVALYYHTSGWLGPALALFAAGLSVVAGLAILIRTLTARCGWDLRIVPPAGICITLQMLALVQFIAIASPILPEVTVFDGGADAILGN